MHFILPEINPFLQLYNPKRLQLHKIKQKHHNLLGFLRPLSVDNQACAACALMTTQDAEQLERDANEQAGSGLIKHANHRKTLLGVHLRILLCDEDLDQSCVATRGGGVQWRPQLIILGIDAGSSVQQDLHHLFVVIDTTLGQKKERFERVRKKNCTHNAADC